MELNLLRVPSAGALPQSADRAQAALPSPLRDGGPRVLIVTAFDAAESLAWSFHEAGAAIEVLCPEGNAMIKLPFVYRAYPYSVLDPLASLRKAIAAAAPDLVIPCDDHIASQLYQLCETASSDDKLKQLLTASLGSPDHFALFHSRVDVSRIAREIGIPCPETVPVTGRADFRRKLNGFGLPAVLKIDRSWGGNGVAIIRAADEAERAFTRLQTYPGFPRALKRLIRDRDSRLIQQVLNSRKNKLSLQRYIEGRRANAAVACWHGETLAAVIVEVLASDEPTGPATLVRVVADPVMFAAIKKMVKRLKLSGLCGFDFIVPVGGGDAELLELNPRVTPTSHLVTAEGQLLAMTLCDHWRGGQSTAARRIPNLEPLFTFPQGRRMRPRSSPVAFLRIFSGGLRKRSST